MVEDSKRRALTQGRCRGSRVAGCALVTVALFSTSGCYRYTSIATTELPRLNDVMAGTEERVLDVRRPDDSLVEVTEVLEVVVVPRDPQLAAVAIANPVRAQLTDEGVLVIQGEGEVARRFVLHETLRIDIKRKDRVGNILWGVVAGAVFVVGAVFGVLAVLYGGGPG